MQLICIMIAFIFPTIRLFFYGCQKKTNFEEWDHKKEMNQH